MQIVLMQYFATREYLLRTRNRDIWNAESCIIQDLILVVRLTLQANYHSFYLPIIRVG